MNRETVKRIQILIACLVLTVLFFFMIKPFIITVVLAFIFSYLAKPVFTFFCNLFKGRENAASLVTLLLIFLIVFIPALILLVLVADEAVKISNSIKPFIDQAVHNPTFLEQKLQNIPFLSDYQSLRTEIMQKTGEIIHKTGLFLFENLSSLTKSTINFLFMFFVMLYTMFFLLKDSNSIVAKFSEIFPSSTEQKDRLLNRFLLTAKATIRGTILIGIIQGGLAGAAFWVAGIDSALFWGVLMCVLSIIPAIGSAIIWLPAAIFLIISGSVLKGVLLLLFCGVVIGSVDNLLRPWLVGKDIKLHDLMIFFGTLGGISLFGIVGFIIGPVIGALFITMWDIYTEEFADIYNKKEG